MILLSLEVLLGFYVGSKVLEKTSKKDICTVKKDNHKDALANADDIEKKANHFVKTSAAAMGLAVIGNFFYRPLTLLNLGLISYR
ncbi:MAG: hypothetical protein ABFS56_28030 [Pseudomonadota bacterium]